MNFGKNIFTDIMGAYMSTLGEKNKKVVIVNAEFIRYYAGIKIL